MAGTAYDRPLSSATMPEGSDSAGRRGRPAPFDQDTLYGLEGLPDEPDFEDLLAYSRQQEQSAASRDAEAERELSAALADADRWFEVEAEATAETRPAVVAI